MALGTMSRITFPARIPFENHLDRRTLHLVRADTLPNNQLNQESVASICNQPLVYETLFEERLKGRPYTQSDAAEFIEWAHSGWNLHTHFVFFVVNEQDQIVGATDIKTGNLDDAEIGYWADCHHPGNVTNAVATMIDSAAGTGFTRFIAYVRRGNDKSLRVLERAGFAVSEDMHHREGFVSLERPLI